MAEIALAAATRVLGQTTGVLSNLALQEGTRWSQLRENIIWIESQMRHIQSYLEDVDAKQGESRRVANLMIDIRELAYEVEDIMETYFPRLGSHQRRGLFGRLDSVTCILRYGYVVHNFAVEIEAIKRRIEDINQVRSTYGIKEGSGKGEEGDTQGGARRSWPHVEETNVIGFEEHIARLEAKLLNNTDQVCNVISIVGMPGIGKTTLAKKVYNSVKSHFECSAWIFVSQNPDIKELFQAIATQVGLAKDEWDQSLETNLFAFLREKRYVIFLDDIWDTRTWDAFKNGIPNNPNNGSRIVVTSRNTSVSKYIGGDSSLHEVLPLNPNHSWELFTKIVNDPLRITNDTISNSQELDSLGRQIVKSCGGLPLAIKVVAGLLLMNERTEHAWKSVLESMGQDRDVCWKIMALSYKNLPLELKPCFLYFGLFPEDRKISAFDLVNLWVAEGFIQAKGGRALEDVGDDYLNHLAARNLIQVVDRSSSGRIKSCRIHDLLHSLCVSIAKESSFFNTLNDFATTNFATTRMRRVATYHTSLGEFISSNYPTNKLRAVLSFHGDGRLGRKHLKKFLRDFRFLRVLRLECYNCGRYLLNEIGNLSHLRYLQLKHPKYFHRATTFTGMTNHLPTLELPSTISNLKYLMTLVVRGCFVIIPDVIWKMKQLRHIFIDKDCRVVRRYCGGMIEISDFHTSEVDLPNLRTLYMPGNFLKANLLHKFTNLRNLAISKPTDQILKELSDTTSIANKLEILWWTVVCSKHVIN